MTAEEIREQLAEYLRLNPNPSPVEVVGAVGADPSVWLDVVEDALAGDTPADVIHNVETDGLEADSPDETPTPDATKTAEQDDKPADEGEINQQTTPEDAGVLVNGEIDFSAVESDTYPPELMDREQWMGRRRKTPLRAVGRSRPRGRRPRGLPTVGVGTDRELRRR
jgi:hypothetical protein